MSDNILSERFKSYKDNIGLFKLALELIKEYGTTDNIPYGKIKQSITNFNEEDLLACCRLAEERAKRPVVIH